MISQREAVTAQTAAEAQAMRAGLKAIEGRIDEMKASMRVGLMGGNPVPQGSLSVLDAKILEHGRTTGRVPDYCDIGISIFYDVYDWHVRNQYPIQISRMAEQRMAIQYKFTQLVLRWENVPGYIGYPFNR
jgi:hypothetical protein